MYRHFHGSPLFRLSNPKWLQFCANGTVASWPAPKGWADAKGVSRGEHAVKRQRLVIDTRSGWGARFRIGADRLTMISGNGDQMLYRRLAQGLEPGKLEDVPQAESKMFAAGRGFCEVYPSRPLAG